MERRVIIKLEAMMNPKTKKVVLGLIVKMNIPRNQLLSLYSYMDHIIRYKF